MTPWDLNGWSEDESESGGDDAVDEAEPELAAIAHSSSEVNAFANDGATAASAGGAAGQLIL